MEKERYHILIPPIIGQILSYEESRQLIHIIDKLATKNVTMECIKYEVIRGKEASSS